MGNNDYSNMTAKKEDEMIDDDSSLFRVGARVKDKVIAKIKTAGKKSCLGL